MNNKKYTIGVVLLLIVIVLVTIVLYSHEQDAAQEALQGQGMSIVPVTTSSSSISSVTHISYACNSGKTIQADYSTFSEDTNTPAAATDTPPTPNGRVDLTLSDGRTMTLRQTISADGARYATNNESFVFWGKGNGALVLENNQAKDFVGCSVVAPQTGNLSQVYHDGSTAFNVRYPADFTADPTYVYQELGPTKDIHGVKFTIPVSVASGTNLSNDSYISVEYIPQTTSSTCSAKNFLEGAVATNVTDNSTDYSFASSTGAGAGNRYEETVYALPYTKPCIAVRYFIHYGVLENYPIGMVSQFDKPALLSQFDAIRRSLIVNQ